MKSDDDYYDLMDPLDGYDTNWYERIGVSFFTEPTNPNFDATIEKDTLRTYRKQAVAEPHYKSGRHDRANHWGAYLALKTLTVVDPAEDYSEELDKLECQLAEDTYYKVKIQTLKSEITDTNTRTTLIKRRDDVLQLMNQLECIMIVEDQLVDGWEEAYEFVFGRRLKPKLLMVENEQAAKDNFDETVGLVLLDVRLAKDRDNECQNETGQNVSELSGVRLAHWLKDQQPAVPIIAATASNKSWTLQSLLKTGISNYWVKDSPESSTDLDHGAYNLLDLYEKLYATVKWSIQTRRWIESIYGIAETVFQHDTPVGTRLKNKSRSVHALLHQSPSPFADELSKGLQQNMAFLVLFSCMNDLITWICGDVECDTQTGEETWFTVIAGNKLPLVKKRAKKSGIGDEVEYLFFYEKDLDEKGEGDSGSPPSTHFPDVLVAIEVLNRLGLLKEASDFRKLKETRNHLPLIHGTIQPSTSKSKLVNRVPTGEIDCLVDILVKLVEEQVRNH
jgi:CheY-like chemotaxis protein